MMLITKIKKIILKILLVEEQLVTRLYEVFSFSNCRAAETSFIVLRCVQATTAFVYLFNKVYFLI